MSDSFNLDNDQNNQDQNNQQSQTFGEGVSQPQDQPEAGSQQVDPQEIEKIKKRLDDKDQFIEQLKNERRQDEQKIATLEEQLQQMKSTEDILQELENRQTSDSQNGTQEGSDNSSNSGQQLSAEEIARQAEERVLERMSQKQQEEKEQENFKTVQNKLTEIYGNKADETVSQIARENDMAWEDAVRMAHRSPKAFLKLFGTEEKQSQATQPTTGSEKPDFNNQRRQPEKKRPMLGGSTKDIVEEWRRVRPEQ